MANTCPRRLFLCLFLLNAVLFLPGRAGAEILVKDDDKVAQRGVFKKNITEIIDRAKAARVRPVILTATVIKEELGNGPNAGLAPCNDFLRALAKNRGVALADLNALFQQRIRQENKPGTNVLTGDGVHMNAEGNKLMAVGVLKALGLDDAQIEKAQAFWTESKAGAGEADQKRAADQKAHKKQADQIK